MSTYLITSTPAHGHIMPLLQIARHLVDQGDEVRFLTSRRYADSVRASGATFVALPAEADVDLDDADAAFPARVGLRGPAALRFDMLNLFLRPASAQFAAVRAELAAWPVDAVLTEPLFIGAALLNRMPRAGRPPVVVLGIFPLGIADPDVAPFGLGIAPLPGPIGRLRNALLSTVAVKVIFGPIQREADALSRRELGQPLGRFFLDWHSAADAVIQFTVAGFEYPRPTLPATVHFVGPLRPGASTARRPAWWADLETDRPVVHVTQGTIANTDFEQLVLPTIRGLADRDVLVVVSTGGRALPEPAEGLPDNVRVADYLPYDQLLPLVDVMVTNGGYGGVQQALAHGVPLVVAGQTEDKVEVSARVGWSGTGLNLRTNRPTAAQVAAATDRVLREDSFRARAGVLAAEIAAASALEGVSTVLQGLGSAGEASTDPVAGTQTHRA